MVFNTKKHESVCEVELLRIDYDIDSPSDEGSLLVKVLASGDEILCCDVDCGAHLEFLVPGNTCEVFFTIFGAIVKLEGDNQKIRIHKNHHKGVEKIHGRVISVKGDWILCDAGFPVYAMSISPRHDFRAGDHIVVAGGLRIEVILK